MSDNLSIIQKVCKKLSKRFTFSLWDEDDIYQEAYLICLELLKKWDKKRSLENFLTVSVSNRLRSFIKSKIGSNSKFLKERKDLVESAADIDCVSESDLPCYRDQDISLLDDLFEFIPFEYRKDYLKLKSGENLGAHRRECLVGEIKKAYICKYRDLSFKVDDIDEYVEKYDLELISKVEFNGECVAQIPGGFLYERAN